MKTIKIYDCSRSAEAPEHRNISRGPAKDNDVIGDLKKYCGLCGASFVDNPKDCDVIITNDIYPEAILAIDKPRVKRMDGIFWSHDLKHRNEPLNQAAEQSDCVIFISLYSQICYKTLYGWKILDDLVILNNANMNIFNRTSRLNRKINTLFTFAAAASNWAREEKRFDDLVRFAENITDNIYLIGQCDVDKRKLPSNIIKLGYLEKQESIAEVLGHAEAFINLSYKDPAPKVVCQAVNCGLPILFANSGGTPEIVDSRGYGEPIDDHDEIIFEDETPPLDLSNIMRSYLRFKFVYKDLASKALQPKGWNSFETLARYFDILKSVCRENNNAN